MSTNREPAPSLPPAAVWRTLLETRVDQVRQRLPKDLQGTLQVAVRAAGRASHFFVELRGRDTKLQTGLHPAATAWIDTEAEGLSAWLSGGRHPALEVSGDQALARRFFESLAKAPAATGLVGIRLGGAL